MGDIERPWNAERDAQRAAQVREAQVATQRGYKTLWILLTVFIISGLALGIAVVNAGQSSRSSDPIEQARVVPSYRAPSRPSGSSDPIEQARVVLGGAYTYDEVKSVTDSALVATGTAVNDDTRNRAWSAVLTLTENLSGVAPMEVMQCVEELGLASDMDFPDTAALCATSISLGG
jgi:hypothetical protein